MAYLQSGLTVFEPFNLLCQENIGWKTETPAFRQTYLFIKDAQLKVKTRVIRSAESENMGREHIPLLPCHTQPYGVALSQEWERKIRN